MLLQAVSRADATSCHPLPTPRPFQHSRADWSKHNASRRTTLRIVRRYSEQLPNSVALITFAITFFVLYTGLLNKFGECLSGEELGKIS